jgi:isopentenyldiphosphate isomerase
MEFHGSMFRDHEIARVYVYRELVVAEKLTLQESEVEEVRWFDLDAVWEEIHRDRTRICVPMGGLVVLREYLARKENN